MGTTERLAWAAGLFDAEGSVSVWVVPPRMRRQISVSQAGNGEVPEVLLRFHSAVRGLGHIRGPVRGYLYYWQADSQSEIDKAAELLWPWLSTTKREQYRRTADAVGRPVPTDQGRPTMRAFPDLNSIAWAAGFFEGEGSLGLYPDRQYWALRAAIVQASRGDAPDALVRFQAALGGLGGIRGPIRPGNPWSRLPQFIWSSSRFEHVQAVLAMFWPCSAYVGERTRADCCSVLPRTERRERGVVPPRLRGRSEPQSWASAQP